MNKLKKLYRDFFGLSEQIKTKQNPNDIEMAASVVEKNPNAFKIAKDTATKSGGNVRIVANESELEEAELVNKITDYQGGVEMLFTDPALAKQTMVDILMWAKKKGFDVITKKIYDTKSGSKAGYIYFRLGEDPYKESQRIQGYISQSPGINKFRFKVKQ